MNRKLFASGIKCIWVLIFIVIYTDSKAQLECKSSVAAYLKPVSEKIPVDWAMESMVTPGYITNRRFFHTNLIPALGYTSGNQQHQFYVEGTAKYWWNNNEGAIEGFEGSHDGYPDFPKIEKKHWGLREMFYQYGKNNASLKAGIQSINSSDYMLVDERILGIHYMNRVGVWKVSGVVATTGKDFARMQNVCGTRHVYRLLRGGRLDFVSNKLFESNFAAFTLSVTPSEFKKSEKAEGSDGIDEFSSFDEFAPVNEKKEWIDEVGLIYYQEFGSMFHDYKYYPGVFSKFNLPFDVDLKTELLYQYIHKERSLSYFFDLKKMVMADKGLYHFNAGYIGKYSIDKHALFYPAFSNLFIGEVMKLDMLQLPLVHGGVKYMFSNKHHTSLKLKAAYQLTGRRSNEIDFEVGSRIMNHVKAYSLVGYIRSDALPEDYFLAKMEFRFTF